MRRRVFIAGVAAVVIGVALKLLLEWEPEPDSIAWHKRGFYAQRFATFGERVQDKWERVRGQPPSQNLGILSSSWNDSARFHALQLEKLGYLRRRQVKLRTTLKYSVVISHEPRLWEEARERLPKRRIWWFVSGTNLGAWDLSYTRFDLLYEPRDEARWEKIIAEVDAETK